MRGGNVEGHSTYLSVLDEEENSINIFDNQSLATAFSNLELIIKNSEEVI